MPNNTPTDQLTMRWRPVTDEAGRSRMEATWSSPSTRAETVAPVGHAA